MAKRKTAPITPVNREAILKQKYGTVYRISVPTDDEGGEAIAYLKKPSRAVLAAALSKSDDPIGSNEIILNSCWLEGDERIKTDDDLFLGAMACLDQMITIRTGMLKKI